MLNVFEKPRAQFVCVSLLFQKQELLHRQFHMPQKEDNKVLKLQKERGEKVLLVATRATDLLSAYLWMTVF